MKVHEAITQLRKHDGAMELGEVALPHDFWRGMICTALKAMRGGMKLDGEQSAAVAIVESLFCGG